MAHSKDNSRYRIKQSIRRKVYGTNERPRLTVYRSNKGISAQVINDIQGKTLASATWLEFNGDAEKKSAYSVKVGKAIAEKAKAEGINKVVFDRNGYRYHGRVKELADAARDGGLEF